MTFEIKGDSTKAQDKVDPILAATAAAQKAHPEFSIEQFGDASTGKASTRCSPTTSTRPSRCRSRSRCVILLLAFGALVAAGLPLLLGVTAVIATMGLVAGVSQLSPATQPSSWSCSSAWPSASTTRSSTSGASAKSAGRAVGKEAALNAAAATSGRAVLVSGLTVMAAMAGMYFAGDNGFAGLATGTIIVVAIAMLGSMTVLPAMLSKVGDGVDRGRIPFLGKRMQRRTRSPACGRPSCAP